MIHIKRFSVVAPEALSTPLSARARADAQTFFARPFEDRRQERFRFQPKIWQGARGALMELFHGKCGFCESPLQDVSWGEIHHFRPLFQKTGDGYWWLAYEWDNLYFVCAQCSYSKRDQFPLTGKPAAPGTKGSELQEEQPLLLDPTLDPVEQHLRFNDDGCVLPLTGRGEATIEIFTLNRGYLVEARLQTLRHFRHILVEALADPRYPEHLKNALSPTRAYAACLRQFAARQFEKFLSRVG